MRERRSRFDVMGQVRTFYLDIAEWATEDAFWAAWAAPCPVRRGDTDGTSRSKQRRAIRPAAEYREPTDAEWLEFQQHFELRKVELGTCARPYGSPCRHEHSCIRCPLLRVDHNQRPRLVEIIRNLADRITEAKRNGWLGEVQGLQVSLNEAQTKLVSLDRRAAGSGPTLLGIPIIRGT
ncbi:hypothetical protein [Micromonospora sp. RTP1Z1]|uniref:hypothetical protein n=1 Tax=Micromonospora sp. RTP1Z1 TaxID=2994043 RepID=UPI0029C86A3A|nr:hypothetical protein [Micromonospora sp. RTP1Z1]